MKGFFFVEIKKSFIKNHIFINKKKYNDLEDPDKPLNFKIIPLTKVIPPVTQSKKF